MTVTPLELKNPTLANNSKTIAIDEEGFFVLEGGIRLQDDSLGKNMLKELRMDEFGVIHLSYDGHDVLVEPFDKPYVAKQVLIDNGKLFAHMPYQLQVEVELESLSLDEWDRFHGMTTNQIPFVLSRPAQAELFNLANDFSDESITLLGKEIKTPNYYIADNSVNQSPFWTDKYKENPLPPWNLEKPHPEIKSILQQIKINKLRILVPGCGYGHDAAFLAEQGHVVTAVDISPEALAGARKRYGHIANLEFIEADVFNLSQEHKKAYDLIFEHTCYCAISPFDRDRLVQAWKSYLDDQGHLLGIFFVVPKRTGPYFGGSEFELREKLESRFKFFYWTRLKHSPGWRNGAELMIYAQLK